MQDLPDSLTRGISLGSGADTVSGGTDKLSQRHLRYNSHVIGAALQFIAMALYERKETHETVTLENINKLQ